MLVLPLLMLATLPVLGAAFVGDHVYIISDAGLSWCCHGRNSGGAQVAQVQTLSIASCICLALPDQGVQPGRRSIGNADAGIRYGLTGVCHQIAGRIMVRFNPSFRRVRGYGATLGTFGAYGLWAWPERAACAAPLPSRSTGGAERSVAWGVSKRQDFLTSGVPLRDDRGSFEEDAVGHARDADAGLAPEVIDAYSRFGYESPEARAAEMSALLDETIAERVGGEERQRVLALHQRLHRDQAHTLRQIDAGELSPDIALEVLTEQRVAFFRRCDEILGRERFAGLFGDDMETTVAEFRRLREASGGAEPD